MQVVSDEIIEIQSNWFSAERDVKRTAGLHLSQVIDYIESLKGNLKRRTMSESNLNAYAAEGFLWERVLERLIEDEPKTLWECLFGQALVESFVDPENTKVIRPGEQCLDAGPCPQCDGSSFSECKPCKGTGRVLVFMTPDFLHLDDVMLEEWKWTTKSSKWPIDGGRHSRWVDYQIPCYLKALGLDTCRLRVNFSRGDYTDGVPIWKEFILKYSQTELDDTWDAVARHAVLMYSNGIVK